MIKTAIKASIYQYVFVRRRKPLILSPLTTRVARSIIFTKTTDVHQVDDVTDDSVITDIGASSNVRTNCKHDNRSNYRSQRTKSEMRSLHQRNDIGTISILRLEHLTIREDKSSRNTLYHS